MTTRKRTKPKHPAESIRSIHPFPARMPTTLVWDELVRLETLLTPLQTELETMLMGHKARKALRKRKRKARKMRRPTRS